MVTATEVKYQAMGNLYGPRKILIRGKIDKLYDDVKYGCAFGMPSGGYRSEIIAIIIMTAETIEGIDYSVKLMDSFDVNIVDANKVRKEFKEMQLELLAYLREFDTSIRFEMARRTKFHLTVLFWVLLFAFIFCLLNFK